MLHERMLLLVVSRVLTEHLPAKVRLAVMLVIVVYDVIIV